MASKQHPFRYYYNTVIRISSKCEHIDTCEFWKIDNIKYQ